PARAVAVRPTRRHREAFQGTGAAGLNPQPSKGVVAMHPTQDRAGRPADLAGADGRGVVTPAATLRAAARALGRHGWGRGAYYDMTYAVFTPAACLVGAIGMVCYGGPVDAPAHNFDDPGFGDFGDAVAYLDRHLWEADEVNAYSFNDAR